MIVYFRLLKESFIFAANALRSNKLRTILSLLGVTVGIFSIIAVLAAVDSLDKKISQEMNSLDKNTIYLFKYEFGPPSIPRWKSDQFPQVKYTEYIYLKNSLTHTDEVSYQVYVKAEPLKFESKIATNVTIVAVSYEYPNIQKLELQKGRFYNESESNSGSSVVVLGSELVSSLFGDVEPIGKKIRIYGQKFTVIGVLKRQGSLFGDKNDVTAYLPVNFVRKLYGDSNKAMASAIVLKPEKDVDLEEYKSQISQKMRNFRGLKPGEIDNFFINVFGSFLELINGIITQMNVVGWIISGFSLLVGGFGIANIMFVSVKERTNQIGIQKSLGAKNRFILFQFLFEAVVLSVIGGLIGLFFVWLITIALNSVLEFEFILSLKNILLGTGLSAFIGVISGVFPAITASKLDPVEAIRTGI